MKKAVLLIIGIVMLGLAPLVIITATAYTMTLPRMYEAEAKLSVKDGLPAEAVVQQEAGELAAKPFFLRTQFEIIQSRHILYKVIDNLRLTKEWGKLFNEDKAPLDRGLAYALLAGSVHVQSFRDTDLVSIRVRMRDGCEAALIANEIAKVYREYRLGEVRERQLQRIDIYTKESNKQHERVRQAEAALERICKELGVAPRGPRVSSGDGQADLQAWRDKYLPVEKAEQTLEQERTWAGELKLRLAKAGIEMDAIRAPVAVVDPAEPSNSPVSPNLIFNMTVATVLAGGLFLAGLILVVMGVLSGRKKAMPPIAP